MTQVAGVKGARFNFAKFSWIGSPTSEVTGFIVHNSFKDLDAVLKADNMRIATGGIGNTTYLTVLLFYKMMGQTNYSFGTGYQGGEVQLAIMRREMDGNFGSYDSRKVMEEAGIIPEDDISQQAEEPFSDADSADSPAAVEGGDRLSIFEDFLDNLDLDSGSDDDDEEKEEDK